MEIQQPPEDGAPVLVASGRADFGVGFQDSMAAAISGEDALPITAVAAIIQHNTSGIISNAGNGMDVPKGLEGHSYATWNGAIELATLEAVMEADGGDFSKVEMIPSTVTDEVSALKTNSVDSIWIFYGWAGVKTELEGLETDYFEFADIDPVFDYYTPVIIANNKFLEEQRLRERTMYDIEMLKETGFCHGIENYSRHIALRDEGETPTTLIDYFPKDFVLMIDESHVTVPQVRGMYNGDRMRKTTLVDYGFRLPSALDNRPLQFDEFDKKLNDVIYVSATPGDYELELVDHKYSEQIIRPTGLLDPTFEVKPTEGQIDDLIAQINDRKSKNERVLITTLTIRMAEELTNYLMSVGIKVAYLHNEVKTLERMKIIHDLRQGKYDVVVGINLLREGIDIPEVSLICIMDANKQGFLRSERSLVQTMGRAARNANGHVIMYADSISEAMNYAMRETERRRSIQEEYNKEHGIVPKTIIKEIREVISNSVEDENVKPKMSASEKKKLMIKIENEMRAAAKELDFERAVELRDILFELKSEGK